MIDSPAEEDKLMWDYCTPGPEALHKEVAMIVMMIMSEIMRIMVIKFSNDNNDPLTRI